MTDYIVNSHRVGTVGEKLKINKYITEKVLELQENISAAIADMRIISGIESRRMGK